MGNGFALFLSKAGLCLTADAFPAFCAQASLIGFKH